MGGRRARDYTEIIGPGAGPERKRVGRALVARDPDALATSSAELIAAGGKPSDILYLASKLVKFVETTTSSAQKLSYAEREKLARQEWTRIKAQEGLKDDPIVTGALVSAVAKALGRGKR